MTTPVLDELRQPEDDAARLERPNVVAGLAGTTPANYSGVTEAARRHTERASEDAQASGWLPLGPRNVGGAIRCLAIRQSTPAERAQRLPVHLAAGSSGGGLWMSTNAGSEVVAPEHSEVELVLRRDFPQKVGVDARGDGLRRFEELRQPGGVEPQQDRVGFHLAALAMDGLDLERSGVVREDGARLEGAILLVEDVHVGGLRCRQDQGPAAKRDAIISVGYPRSPKPITSSRYCSNSAKPWSEPATIRWRAPG